MPTLESVAGQPVKQVWDDGYVSTVGTAGCHPIYFINHTTVYQVTTANNIPSIKIPVDKNVCGAPKIERTKY
jgi:hypothetical protein